LLPGVFLCLLPALSLAQDHGALRTDALQDQQAVFQPVITNNDVYRLPFDLAGSDARSLQLQLSEPLSLQVVAESRWLHAGTGSLLAGGTLAWSATDRLTLGTVLEQEQSRIQFQPLASIHCANGILEAGSYRASGCYITNDVSVRNLGTLSVGAQYDIADNSLASISLFREQSSMDAAGILPGSVGIGPAAGSRLTAQPTDGLVFSGLAGGSPLNYFDSKISGIDLEFKLGVSTDRAGDMQLGLQFTRVLDGELDSAEMLNSDLLNWTLADPVDSAAVRFDWALNSLSGGIQGYYREPMSFLNGSNADALTTFDVYFTWRTPWNASLSVGASNLLNSGVDDKASRDNSIKDPFESVYGRIPYVRYQQDL
jgi:hypothetical protein